MYGQNGDTVSAKTATNKNGDKLYDQNGDNYRLIFKVVLTLFKYLFEIVYGVSAVVPMFVIKTDSQNGDNSRPRAIS